MVSTLAELLLWKGQKLYLLTHNGLLFNQIMLAQSMRATINLQPKFTDDSR